MRKCLRFVFRNEIVELTDFSPHETLLDWIRLRARAVGTKEGCAEGDCGACTVVLARARDGHIEHRTVNACILLLGQVDGAELITIEDLAQADALHPVQEAMVAQHGSQCGFCTPGIVMSLFAHYHEAQRPVSKAGIADRLAGNLCRCTGYRPIVDAALDACAGPAADGFARAGQARLEALHGLVDGEDLFCGSRERFFAAPASEKALGQLYLEHTDALLVAGSTDVGLTITKGLQTPAKIVWLGRIAGFDAIETGGGQLSIMAGATHADAFSFLAGLHNDLGEIMRRFGSAQVRASGTVGGNIANGSPIGDLAPCLIALGARIELRRGEASRELPLENFFIAYKKQDRLPGEYVRRLIIPALPPDAAFRAFKISKRFDEDISAVLGAFRFAVEDGVIVQARIAFGGMAATPARARRAESACIGLRLDDPQGWQTGVSALAEDFNPIGDMRASAEYRALVAANLLRKTLLEIAGAGQLTRINMVESVHASV